MGVFVLGGILYVILITVAERPTFQDYRARASVVAQEVVHSLRNIHSNIYIYSRGAAEANSTNVTEYNPYMNVTEYNPYINLTSNSIGKMHKVIESMLAVTQKTTTESALDDTDIMSSVTRMASIITVETTASVTLAMTDAPVSTVISNKPILTLFTTFRESESKRFIYENTIRNWHLLSPDIIPILFTDNDPNKSTSVAHFAMQQGWKVLPVPKTSPKGIPVLRHMFLKAQEKFDTQFYCYANSDILFDRNLTDTLRFLQSSARGGRIDKLLMVGRRSNWSIKQGLKLTDLSQVGHYVKNSSLFISNAQDYFLTTRDGYPWTTIPDFVVGRVGYDNWLVVTALVKKIPVVDATETVTALHQTGTDGNSAGFGAKFEKHINYGLAKGFDYGLGHVTCGHFATQRKDGKMTITERKLNGKKCNQRKVAFVKSPFT